MQYITEMYLFHILTNIFGQRYTLKTKHMTCLLKYWYIMENLNSPLPWFPCESISYRCIGYGLYQLHLHYEHNLL